MSKKATDWSYFEAAVGPEQTLLHVTKDHRWRRRIYQKRLTFQIHNVNSGWLDLFYQLFQDLINIKTLINIYFRQSYILWHASYCILGKQLQNMYKSSYKNLFCLPLYSKLFSHSIENTVGFLCIQLLKIIHVIAVIYESTSI